MSDDRVKLSIQLLNLGWALCPQPEGLQWVRMFRMFLDVYEMVGFPISLELPWGWLQKNAPVRCCESSRRVACTRCERVCGAKDLLVKSEIWGLG